MPHRLRERGVPGGAFLKPLVIGASGLVGGAFFERFRELGARPAGTFRTRPSAGLVRFGLDQDAAGFLDSLCPSLVVLASALTHVDYCETHESETLDQNVERLRPVAGWCAQHEVPLVFFSTDYVFDGSAGPYEEGAARRPINVYGRSKLLGEDIVLALPRRAIVRITNVFDAGRDDKNFLHRCVTALRDRRELIVPGDQLATPTYAPWLAAQVLELVGRGTLCGADSPAILHVACDDCVSRVDFAARVAALLGADASLLRPRTTPELGQAAPRPLRGGLRNDMLKRFLGVAWLSLDDALRDCLPRMRSLYGARS